MSRPEHQQSRLTDLSCLVVIPAHNEEADIARVIDEIRQYSDFPIVVIDDASTDNTVKSARATGAMVVPLSMQLGAWGAIQTGLRYAISYGYQYCITMDADGQHEARSLESLLRPVLEGRADVTIGACTRRGSVLRKIAWKIMKRASGLSLEDITSGFRVYNRKAMNVLATWQATLLQYQDIGVLALLQSVGIKIMDVEVTMLPRRSGTSRIFYSWFIVIYYMCHTLLLGFSKRGMTRKPRI